MEPSNTFFGVMEWRSDGVMQKSYKKKCDINELYFNTPVLHSSSGAAALLFLSSVR